MAFDLANQLGHLKLTKSISFLQTTQVWVTHCVNPELFYVRFTIDDQQFNQMEEQLTNYCTSFAPEPVDESFHAGDYLLAFNESSKKWCRAKVKRIDDVKQMDDEKVKSNDNHVDGITFGQKIQVDLIDYGPTECVYLKKCKKITDHFVGFNQGNNFARKCCLVNIKPNGIEWDEHGKKSFKYFTINKKMTMHLVKFYHGTYHCDLSYHLNGERIHSLVESLVFSRSAKFRLGDQQHHRVNKDEFKYAQSYQVI